MNDQGDYVGKNSVNVLLYEKENPMSPNIDQKVSPEVPATAQLMQMIFGFMNSQAISVAAKLGVADLLTEGAKSADELARATGAHPRSLYRIMRALAGGGIFAEDETGRFRLTPLAEPLRRDAPDSLRSLAIFLAPTGTGAYGATSPTALRPDGLRSRVSTAKRTLIILPRTPRPPRSLMMQ